MNQISIRACLFIVIICALIASVDSVVSKSNVSESDPYIYLPTISKHESPPLINGNFESGAYGWGQYSSNGWPLIVKSDLLPVPPHGGVWGVWMGGDDNEDADLWQTVRIPAGSPKLTYWLWIASSDACGFDVAGVAINLTDVVDGYWLCSANNTSGWLKRTVDLSPFAGQTAELDFVAFTDEVLNSNLFIDDVSLGDSSAAPFQRGIIDDVTSNDALASLKKSSLAGIDNQPADITANSRLEVAHKNLLILLTATEE